MDYYLHYRQSQRPGLQVERSQQTAPGRRYENVQSFQNALEQTRSDHHMFVPVYGVITQLKDTQTGAGEADGCSKFVTIEQENGNIVNFIVSPATCIIGQVTFRQTQQVVMFYDPYAPVPLIYPPQYRAVAAGQNVPGVMAAAGYFDGTLLSADRQLQLNLSVNTLVRTSNNQSFTGNPGGRNLVVLYEFATKSIPAQTTPAEVIVMCGCGI